MNKKQYNQMLSKNDFRIQIHHVLVVFYCIFCLMSIILLNFFEYNGFLNYIVNYGMVLIPIGLFVVECFKKHSFTNEFISILLLLLYETIIALIGIFSSINISKTTLFGQYLSSLSFTILIYVAMQNKYSKKTINFMFGLNICLSIILILLYFSDKSYKYNGTINVYPWLTLNFYNPNYTAMILLGNFSILLLSFNFYKSIIMKIANCLILLFVLYMIYLTNSRTCFFIAMLLMIFILFGIRLKKWHIVVALLMPILFFALYNSLYGIESLHNLEIMGKPLFSGRVELWQEKLKVFYQSPINLIFGNFAQCKLENAHNGFLTVFINYGLLGIVLYYGNLYIQLESIFLNAKGNRKISGSIYVLLGFILVTLAEAGIVILGKEITLFSLISAVYAKYVIESNNLPEKNFLNKELEDSKC